MLKRPKRTSTTALLGFLLALAAAGTAVLCGIAYRLEVLDLPVAFDLLRWTAFAGLATAVISAVGLMIALLASGRRGAVPALLGLVLGSAVFWLPYSQYRAANSLPPIHDITTDTGNPPNFNAIVPLRADAPNGHIYGGPVIAAQQKQAYTDIQTARFDAPRDSVFEAALSSAGEMGWQIIAVSAQDGRVEATDTTLWFGFKDDIVIRVGSTDDGTAVDVRSVSRVGRSDLGKNASRVRNYLSALRSRFDTP